MKKIVVGMSGGVDSSVAAYLLKKDGYDVIGVTMQIWQEENTAEVSGDGGCCGLSAVEDARRVAHALGIPHYVMNFRDEFKRRVIDYFVREYRLGRTPNPCIACNRYVKWEALLSRALSIGADGIATGHYAGVVKGPNGRYTLKTAKTAEKDQTYALYGLTQEQLARTWMPLGEYTKEEVRGIAEELGLLVAHKPDSQEICFIPDNDYGAFLDRELCGAVPEGNFVDRKGRVLGRHKGITHYTIGQRKGLNLAMGHPVFVTEIRPETDEVVIGEAEEVFTGHLICKGLHFMAEPDFPEEEVTAKIRYNHKGARCLVRRTGPDEAKCYFSEPVRAATPGQAVVFYRDGCVLGGGTIERGME
ncbi:MAG: tRNA 2-thiouridine(34) synthase MnmA [Lachnospiraceae bacterium]|nr:tRNA 2-thiouridine(34) synthase MnmA [Lachnospiraceae bacterium]